MEDWLDLNPDPVHVKREREKARALRATDWWRAQLARGECHYCHGKFKASELTMDHVVPVARGGRSTRGNCVPCCRDCNAKKKAYTPAERILDSLFAGIAAVALCVAVPLQALASVPPLSVESAGMLAEEALGRGMSGLTWLGGSRYVAVCDCDGSARILDIDVDGCDGSPRSCAVVGTVRLEGCLDLEGCAYDAPNGTLWASDEKTAAIAEFDLATGRRLRAAPVPEVIAKSRLSNYNLEALSISPDALSMWTANEEALKCDGPRASAETGTTVRIVRFTRPDPKSEWSVSGMWAYTTERLAEPNNPTTANRCGVAGMCALPGGTLLVLERELSGFTFRFRLYAVDFEGADDVSAAPSLGGAAFRPVGKTLLASYAKRYSIMRPNAELGNFEGICLGPELQDGSRALVLIADAGDMITRPLVKTLRLRGGR